MSSRLFRILSFLKYLWEARSNLYLHSPFVFEFYNNLLKRSGDDKELKEIRAFRKDLKSNGKIKFSSYGKKTGMYSASYSEILSNVSVKHKYGKLLYKCARYFDLKNIIELGTNVGISTLYLSKAKAEEGRIITIEGSQELYSEAVSNFKKMKCTNIYAVNGEFEKEFKKALETIGKIDLIFFDGNHDRSSTLSYFETALPYAHQNSVFIFDDIYWSEEMSEAWCKIKSNPYVVLTIDIYQFGFVFFDKTIKAKQDFILRY